MNSPPDGTIAKVMALGVLREEAHQRLIAALDGSRPPGPAGSRGLLLSILHHPDLTGEKTTTRLLQKGLLSVSPPSMTLQAVAALLLSWPGLTPVGTWRNAGLRSWQVSTSVGRAIITRLRDGLARVEVPSGVREISPLAMTEHLFECQVDGVVESFTYSRFSDGIDVEWKGLQLRLEPLQAEARLTSLESPRLVLAPMNGRVIRIVVAVGEKVQSGDLLVLIEAMTLEMEVRARINGVVDTIPVTAGETVIGRQPLITLVPN